MIVNEFTRSWLEGFGQESRDGGDMAPNMTNALPVQALEVEDIAADVAFLASDEARYITGVTRPVNASFVNKR